MFENSVLKGIFGYMREEVIRRWRKLHNEDLNNLYSSSSLIRDNKWRSMRRMMCVHARELCEMHTKFWLRGLTGREFLRSRTR
jgi:hypothetical protein